MSHTVQSLRRLLPKTMMRDRTGFYRELERLGRESEGQPGTPGQEYRDSPCAEGNQEACNMRNQENGENRSDGRNGQSVRNVQGGRNGRDGRNRQEKRNGRRSANDCQEEQAMPFDKRLERLAERMVASAATARERREKVPKTSYDEELPVCQRREEIAKLLRENQVVVVCGETGSGKSTQLPKICLDLGRGIYGMIGHTQPRRIAARAIARRIAEELKTPLGDGVGFKVRFADETCEGTYVKVMTDGVLLAESQHDPMFERYDTIIIDEAHERSLNIDFLLGMMKRVLARRRDFKLIITSATIDAKRFALHFATRGRPAPIIEVSGRTYPIEILYRPPEETNLDDGNGDAGSDGGRGGRRRTSDEEDQRDRAFLDAVDELALCGRGDILVFLPTQRHILEASKLLKHHPIPGDDPTRKTEILPLYARLSFAEQQRIFTKSRWRKIVIATNVAESSLTVPGIRYVIDFGTARMSRYSSRSRTQRLPIEPISRASADQRAGRCGRVGPGVCIRLYSEDDYNARDEFTTPEIRRTNLASVILTTIAYRLGAIEKFPFIDPPGRGTIEDGYKTLFELGAIDENNHLTEIGRRLSRLPVDPRIARMILAAMDEGVLAEVLVIASVLELQDPRERPLEAAAKADEAHAQFVDENSDFLSYLKMWDFWKGLKDKLSGSQLRKACHQNFLSFNRMREWSDIHVQLLRLLRETKMIPEHGAVIGDRENYDAIHRSILTGMLIGIAWRNEKGEYVVAGSTKFGIWPGSGLLRKRHPWVVAAERVETSARYLRCVAKINPDWIEPLAGHLLTKTMFDPFWLRETGYVHAFQRVSLFGLTIIPKRRVHFGPTDPKKAREIFIEHALVQGDFDCRLEFFQKNQKMLEEVEKLQAKLREYNLLKGDADRYAFYDARIPAGVYDRKTLADWHRALGKEEREHLLFTFADLCDRKIDQDYEERFPDSLSSFSGTPIPLDYQFKPGEQDDGLTATVSPDEFGTLRSTKRIGWLVPGLLEQKILHLLKSLPKEIRRPLVPMPDTARRLVEELNFGNGDFGEALARGVSRLAGRLVTPSDFDLDRVPASLLLNIRVVDDSGNLLAEGRDPDKIQDELGIKVAKTLTAVSDSKWIRDGIDRWDFGSLPESVILKRDNMTMTAHPALCDLRFLENWNPAGVRGNGSVSAGRTRGARSVSGKGASLAENTLSLRLFDHSEKAVEQTRLGVVRMFAMRNRRELKMQLERIPGCDRIRIRMGGVPNFDFSPGCMELIARHALEIGTGTDVESGGEGLFDIPRNEGEYNLLCQAGERSIAMAVQGFSRWLPRMADAFCDARLCMEKHKSPLFAEAGTDSRETLERLFMPGFHLMTPARWLREFPRYLAAIPLRYEKLKSGGAVSDCEYSAELAELWGRCLEIRERHENAGIVDPEWELYRWMLEEYRVSLFAQRLGTSIKVSSVRLDRQWEKVVKQGSWRGV